VTSRELTAHELSIVYLLASLSRPVTAYEVMAQVWGRTWHSERKCLHVHVTNLRRKLKTLGVEVLFDKSSDTYQLCNAQIRSLPRD
jgi:DNA-binding response OmpR family regulator